MILTVLQRKLMLWGGGALVVALLGLIATAVWQNKTINTLRAQNGTLLLRVENAVEANKTNVKVIHELEKANSALLERIRLDVVAAEEAAQRARERAGALQRERDAARAGLDAALASEPSCEDLARLDVGSVCPALGDRLLDLQRRSRQD